MTATDTLSYGQESVNGIAIPKARSLPVELLQSRMYSRGIEMQLDFLEKNHPELKLEIRAARASWLSSPFAGGADFIERDAITKAGDKAKKILVMMDKKGWSEYGSLVKFNSKAEVRTYLNLIDKRAKGEIEVDFVRANLLWHYPPYRQNPEKEVSEGFVVNESFANFISFKMPMSWKNLKSPAKSMLGYKSENGHGRVWLTIHEQNTVDDSGKAISAKQAFEAHTINSFSQVYSQMGIDLLSFKKTKSGQMDVWIFERSKPYEKLGNRGVEHSICMRFFYKDTQINYKMNVIEKEGTTYKESLINRHYKKLFNMIGHSVKLSAKP